MTEYQLLKHEMLNVTLLSIVGLVAGTILGLGVGSALGESSFSEVMKYATFLAFWIGITLATAAHEINRSRGYKLKDDLAVVGVVRKVYQPIRTSRGEHVRYEIAREQVYPFSAHLASYMEGKEHNFNIAIAGQSGSGKSILTYWLIRKMPFKHIIFSYKNSDMYVQLGFPVLYIRNFSPNVFLDKESFVQAWVTAFVPSSQGITASAIEPLVRSIVSKCSNWQEFSDEVERRLRRAGDNYVTSGALADIQSKLESVYNEKMYSLDLPDEITIDFSGLNENAFTFNAEYLLRSIYRQIKDGSRTGTMIFCDEAERFLRAKNTILREMSSMIRSRGAFLLSTQRLSDLQGIVGNAASQFVFRQTESEDLQRIRSLSEEFRWTVQRLHAYEFVDLAQHESHLGIYIFKLIAPNLEFSEIREWKPDRYSDNTNDVFSRKTQAGPDSTILELEKEVFEQLAQPRNAQEIAKRIAEKTGEDVNTVRFRITATNGAIDRLMRQGKISSLKLDFVKFVNNRTYFADTEATYYFRTGTYDFHDFVVSMVASILTHRGIDCRVMHHGESVPDIIAGKMAIEVETTDKRGENFEKVRRRIEREKQDGYTVMVIVSSQDLKSKYQGIDGVSIFTPRELWQTDLSDKKDSSTDREG